MPAALQLPQTGTLPSHGEPRRWHSQHCGLFDVIVGAAGCASCWWTEMRG
jgi:predicted phage tail protein